MKLDDKAIEQITAMLTAEIEEEEAKAAKAAAEAAGEPVDADTAAAAEAALAPAADTAVPFAEDAPAGTVSRDTAFLDIAELLEEIQHMTDDMPADEATATAVIDAAKDAAEPGDMVEDVAELSNVAEPDNTDTAAETAEAGDEESAVDTAEAVEADKVSDADEADESSDTDPAEESAPSVDTDATDDETGAEATDATDDAENAEPADAPTEASVKQPREFNISGAILYALVVIAITALSVLGVSLLDKNVQQFKPIAPANVQPSNLAASLQTYTAAQVIANEGIPQYSLDQIYAMDLRKPSGATEADLKKVTKAGLVGLEDTFLEAEEKYGVNAVFLMSIASLESAHGTQMYRPNNMFGYGGKSYPSKEACIMDVASGLSSRYLKPGASLYGGSPTLKGVNKRYAANPQWYAKVGKYMKSYYDVITPYHNQSLEKIK